MNDVNGAASLAGRPAVGGFRAAWHSHNFVEQKLTNSRDAKIVYPYGIKRFTFRASALFTSVNFFKRRMRFGPFVPSKCRLPECERTILPFFVILKRLAAPRCVFNFSFLATVSFSQLFFLRCRFYTTICSAHNQLSN
jgi:hypothetical protein